MTANRSLMRGPDGEWFARGHGNIVNTLEWDAMTGVLPSWLTLTSGTGSFNSAVQQPASYQVMSAATTTSAATLSFNPSISIGAPGFNVPANGVRSVYMQIRGFQLDASGAPLDLQFNLRGASSGVYARQLNGEANVTLWKAGGSSGVATKQVLTNGGNGLLRRNLGFWVFADEGEFYALEDDREVGYTDLTSAFPKGAITPAIIVTTRENVAHGFKLSGIKLEVFSN